MSAENYNALTRCAQQCQIYLEPQVEVCPLVFGGTNEFGTCGATGKSCRNTWETCKRACDYVCRNKSEAWTKCETQDFLESKQVICDFPTSTGGKVEFCGGLPSAGITTVEIQDFDDKGEPGTYIEKWVQSNNWETRYAKLSYGFCGADLANDYFDKDLYIDDMDGPRGQECKFSVKLKDAFALLNDENAKFPRETKNELRSPLTAGSEFILIESGEGFDSSAEAFCVNGEVVRIEWVRSSDGVEQYRIIERAVCGSKKNTETVPLFTPVQIVKRYEKGTHAAELIFDIFHRDGDGLPYATNPDGCDCGPFIKAIIDAQQFREILNDPCYSRMTIDETYICEPTGIRSLYKELIPFMLIPYMDQCSQRIKLSVYEPPKCTEEIPIFEQEWIADCDIEVKSLRKDRYSNVRIFSNPDDCTKGISDGNIEAVGTAVNLFGLGDACNNPAFTGFKEKKIKTRFIRGCNYNDGDLYAKRLDYVLRQKRRRITFTYPAFMIPEGITQTSKIRVNHKKLQNYDGDPSQEIFWINSIDLVEPNCYKVVAESSGFRADERWADSLTCDGECPVVLCDMSDGCAPLEGNKIW